MRVDDFENIAIIFLRAFNIRSYIMRKKLFNFFANNFIVTYVGKV